MQDSTRILQDLQAELEHAPLCCCVVACLPCPVMLLCCCLLACLLLSRSKTAISPHTGMGFVRRTPARWKDRRLISDDFFVRTGTRDLRVRAAEKWSEISRFPLGYGPPRYRDWYLDILFDQSHNIKFCAQSGLAQENVKKVTKCSAARNRQHFFHFFYAFGWSPWEVLSK